MRTWHGLCPLCWQRDPQRPYVRAGNLREELGQVPVWFEDYVRFLAAGHCPSRAAALISALGVLLKDVHPNRPDALVARAILPGRSMGTLARSLETFFSTAGLAMPTDHARQLAAGRRHRRIEAVPEPLRPTVRAFEGFLLASRQRAHSAGTLPRADSTIEGVLAGVRDFALFLAHQANKHDWALTTRADIEVFLAQRGRSTARTLSILKQFFAWSRSHKVLLIDPAVGIPAVKTTGSCAPTLTLAEERILFRRWCTGPDVHPHEALTGLLAMLHGATCTEIRSLAISDVDHVARMLRLGLRPQPTPLDPPTWTALVRCLEHRERLRTTNPHIIVTRGTKANHRPASAPYLSHILDAAGTCPRALRTTRLTDLVHTMDAKLVAAAFGISPEGALHYLADHIDPTRLPANPTPFGAT